MSYPLAGISPSGGITDLRTNTSGDLQVVNPPVSVTPTSGTITAGGTAQALIAATATGYEFSVYNSGTLPLYISIGGTASATTTAIYPGDTYISDVRTSSAVSIFGSTTAQPFYLEKW